MSKKTTRKVHEDFESFSDQGRFAKITFDMMQSKAWTNLSLRQIGLYLLFKSKFTKSSKGTDTRDNLTLPKDEWSKLYKTPSSYYQDLDMLIALGFIRVVTYQGYLRKPTIYGLSAMWKHYGKDGFIIKESDKRPTNVISKEHKKRISDGAKAALFNRHANIT
ncbi:hypothetical protein [Desulfosporosinus sp.]|uniref:hypothetical protein n=1 Tax=Desulfosporosinus sp. TaxID=157907 RepID=UPI002615A83A|nr:hypothetical protein [Desulfosporosinus sp.]